MKQGIFEIAENKPVNGAGNVYRMRLIGDTEAITAPGQFVSIRLDGHYLRRPISVCDRQGDALTLIYKTVGQGTLQMAGAKPGEKMDLLAGLGNGYDVNACDQHPLVIGGGVGIPPLYGLAKALLAAGKQPAVILGFNKMEEIFLVDAFKALGAPVLLATADGSEGIKGFVTDIMEADDPRYVFACGPLPMLKAVYKKSGCPSGQYSLEERMGCGFGACMGCTIETRFGPKRVCKDGPIFRKEELPW